MLTQTVQPCLTEKTSAGHGFLSPQVCLVDKLGLFKGMGSAFWFAQASSSLFACVPGVTVARIPFCFQSEMGLLMYFSDEFASSSPGLLSDTATNLSCDYG